jgi:hypothetical protein
MEAASSRAEAALSNFWKLFSLRLKGVLVTLLSITIFLRLFSESVHSHSNFHSKELEDTIDVQVGNTLGGGSLLGDIITLEELLVLGLQQGIARAGLSKDEKRHGARPRRLGSKINRKEETDQNER